MDWSFNYIAITNNIEEARIIESCGIQQILVDIENIGKSERQSGTNAVINFHNITDVSNLKNAGIKAKIICRINSFHSGSFAEIDEVINAKADFIMIPMINNINHYNKMTDFIGDRIEIIPLIETPYSVFKINDILKCSNINQIHFGLNDLCLALGTKNIFEILLSPVFSFALEFVNEHVKLIGIGGIGNPLEQQKVDPSLILQLHKLFGSKSVILSRSFFKMGYEINKIETSLRQFEKQINSPLGEKGLINFKEQVENF